MHSPFRHTALPQTTDSRCPVSVPISLTADTHFGARLGAFFIEPDVLKTMYRSTISLYDLSDQSALEIRVRI